MNPKVKLADISSSDDKRILYSAFQAEPTETCSGKRYKWLRTVVQPEQRKRMWSKALRLTFQRP